MFQNSKVNGMSNSQREMEAVATALYRAAKDGLETEVILFAMRALKRDPSITIEQALNEGINEWIK